MARQNTAKLERVVEAVRQGFEGDDALEFMHRCGYSVTSAGIARHLRGLGGRGNVQTLIGEGLANELVLERCVADKKAKDRGSQSELFSKRSGLFSGPPRHDVPLYSTTKLSIRIPSELYEAIRVAAKGEGKSQNQLVIDILASSLSQLPGPVQEEFDGA